MSDRGPPLLSVSDIGLSFGGLLALNGVSFDVWPGELFAIIGPNGAGKTTTLNCLSGLFRPSHGRIVLAGTNLIGRRPPDIAALGLARTFQNLGLFANLSVMSNILLGRHHLTRSGFFSSALRLPGARREETEQRAFAEQVLVMLGIEPYRDRPVGTLPYGIRKLVELGRALAMEPKLLLLDEPAAGLNMKESEDLAIRIDDVRAQGTMGIILIEHDMQFVMDLADRIMVMDFGAPIATGAPVDIQRNARVIGAYLGSPLAASHQAALAGRTV